MLLSSLSNKRVLAPKGARARSSKGEIKLRKLGRVRFGVFDPAGTRLVGLVVRRPDVVGMVRRDDTFVAWDRVRIDDDGTLLLLDPTGARDDEACTRLGLDWDACIIWMGMDAHTREGRHLGHVSDAEFDAATGRVDSFCASNGQVADAIVGSFRIPVHMVVGYSNGAMVVDQGDEFLDVDGGLAATAGAAAASAGAAVSSAVEKGSHALGHAIGKAKAQAAQAKAEAAAEEEAAKAKQAVVEASDKPSVAEPQATQQAVRAVGRQMGRLGGMFSAFKDEYDKARHS